MVRVEAQILALRTFVEDLREMVCMNVTISNSHTSLTYTQSCLLPAHNPEATHYQSCSLTHQPKSMPQQAASPINPDSLQSCGSISWSTFSPTSQSLSLSPFPSAGSEQPFLDRCQLLPRLPPIQPHRDEALPLARLSLPPRRRRARDDARRPDHGPRSPQQNSLPCPTPSPAWKPCPSPSLPPRPPSTRAAGCGAAAEGWGLGWWWSSLRWSWRRGGGVAPWGSEERVPSALEGRG